MLTAFFEVDPGHLAINQAKRCTCRGQKPATRPSTLFKAAMRSVRAQAERIWFAPVGMWDGPVYPDGAVWVEYSVTPAQVHRKGPGALLPRLDVDACCKGLLDALSGIAYADDCQVVRVVGTKTTVGPTGISVRIHRPEETG